MLLKSLKLENIRSYTNDSISFTPGSSLLLGDIGAGKTSVLLGIEFALFGLIKGDVSGSTLLRHGKNSGGVELHFIIDNKDIIISRRLKRKFDTVTQDSGFIIIDGKKIGATPVELKSKVLELFGYPEDLLNKNTSLIYRYTVYTPQEDMKEIIFESRDERLDTLRKIFNIDKYKRIRENALNYGKELRAYKKILEGKISDLEQKREEHKAKLQLIDTKKLELAESRTDFLQKKKLLDDRTSEIKKFEEQIKELGVLRKDFAISENNLNNKKADIERIGKELSIAGFRINEYENKLKEMGVIDKSEEQLKAMLSDAEDKLTKINSAKELVYERLESKLEDLRNMPVDEQVTLGTRRTLLQKKLEEKSSIDKQALQGKEELASLLIDINTIQISKSNSEKIIGQLMDLSVCPVCQQPVDFSHKVKITDKENANILNAERRISQVQGQYKDAEARLKSNHESLEGLRNDELELREIEIKLENLAARLESRKQLEKDIEDLKARKDKLDKIDVNMLMNIISRNRKMLSNIEVRKHIEESLKEKITQREDLTKRQQSAFEEMNSLKQLSDSLSKRIDSYSDTEKVYSDLISERDKMADALKDSEIILTSITKDLETANSDAKRLHEEIDAKIKVKDRITYLAELNFWLSEHFISLTSTIEKAIMQRVHNEFDELFRKWFDILMDTDDLDVSLDEEFTPIIIQNNYETDIINLSGGERTSVALAYRLALNKVINDFISTIKTKDIIILDEPTDGFSSEQLDKMRDVFDELHIGQMIIVSHEAKMESYVQNIVRIAKNEHNSKVLI